MGGGRRRRLLGLLLVGRLLGFDEEGQEVASTAAASTARTLAARRANSARLLTRVEVERVHVEEATSFSTFTVARSRPSVRGIGARVVA